MRAIVALGNPGPEYAVSRHNAGFLLADTLREQWGLPRYRRQGPALVSAGRRRRRPVVLLKPQTHMNRSGEALGALLANPGFDPTRDLLVLVDDVALPLGSLRLRARGSSGGHHGLDSVEAALGSPAYARLRIGVGPMPPDLADGTAFVLASFSEAELSQLADLLPTLCDAVECWLAEGIDAAMNRFNRRSTTRD